MCLHWSDIDLVVGATLSEAEKEDTSYQHFNIMDKKIKESLRKIADSLKGEIANSWVTTVHYIDAASVPVIKLKISLQQLMIQAGHPFP